MSCGRAFQAGRDGWSNRRQNLVDEAGRGRRLINKGDTETLGNRDIDSATATATGSHQPDREYSELAASVTTHPV